MTTLEELAAMLDSATGPSREMDVAAFQTIFPETRVYEAHCPPLTSSIDAALALVERELPGALLGLWKRDGEWNAELNIAGGCVGGYEEECIGDAVAPTAPLAILKALVAALIAQEKNDD